MDLAKQTRATGTRFDDVIIEIGKRIAVSLTVRILERIARRLAARLSYPWALSQVKFLTRVNSRLLSFTVPYASLQESRLSPLAPIVGFYLWGIQRIIWTGFTPHVDTLLAQIVQHTHTGEGKALTMASRSAKALALVFSLPRTDRSWEMAYSISQMFYVSSTVLVHPTQVVTKPFSKNGTGTQVSGRSWSLWLALKLIMMTRKLGKHPERMGNLTSQKVSRLLKLGYT